MRHDFECKRFRSESMSHATAIFGYMFRYKSGDMSQHFSLFDISFDNSLIILPSALIVVCSRGNWEVCCNLIYCQTPCI